MPRTKPNPIPADPIAIRAAFQALADDLGVRLPWKPLATSLDGTSDYAKAVWW